MGFQAVIKSAASAASLGPRKIQIPPEKIKEKLPFWAVSVGSKPSVALVGGVGKDELGRKLTDLCRQGGRKFLQKSGRVCSSLGRVQETEPEILYIFCYFFASGQKLQKQSRDQVGR